MRAGTRRHRVTQRKHAFLIIIVLLKTRINVVEYVQTTETEGGAMGRARPASVDHRIGRHPRPRHTRVFRATPARLQRRRDDAASLLGLMAKIKV